MLKLIKRNVLAIVIISILCSCSAQQMDRNNSENSYSSEQQTILISAAASLSDVLDQLTASYEDRNPHIHIDINYGSSGSLQKQIEQGAPVDLFFSAGQRQMDQLMTAGFIKHTNVVLQNELVVITRKGASTIKDDLTSSNYTANLSSIFQMIHPQHIAIGIPESVPAGQYAKQALEAEGIWEKWESNVVLAKDVRQVLAYVEQGNAEMGIVYATDALLSEQVEVIYSINPQLHDQITYPIAVMQSSKHEEEAELLYQFLKSDEAKKNYESFGFKIVE